MNDTLKNIITNPFVIGGTALGAGAVTAAVIYAKKRPKTDAEIALEKEKEANAQALKLRELEIKKSMDELAASEETKRQAKEQEERTKRAQIELEKLKEENAEAERQWTREKDAPQGYWDREIARVKADKEQAAMEKELETQKEIARLQADAVKSEAEANAKAAKEAAWRDIRRQESSDRMEAAKVQAITNGIAAVVTGKNN